MERGFAANKYGSRKDKDYNAIISAKNLDLHYQSVTFGTFGSFGTGTWSVITKACDPASHPKAVDDDNPWNAPGPKRDLDELDLFLWVEMAIWLVAASAHAHSSCQLSCWTSSLATELASYCCSVDLVPDPRRPSFPPWPELAEIKRHGGWGAWGGEVKEDKFF